jgi:hypothetical protein
MAMIAVIILFASCRIADSPDIERVRAHHFAAYPHASIGQMIDKLFPNAVWTKSRGTHGEVVVTATGSVPAELQVTLNGDASSITSLSFVVNGEKQSQLTTKQFFDLIYRLVYPEVQLIMGRWVNEEGYERMLYFRPNGTFHMHCWPWDTSGSYEIDSEEGTIILRPDPPLDPAVSELNLAYSVADDNHIVFTDADADVFLVPHPLRFERQ